MTRECHVRFWQKFSGFVARFIRHKKIVWGTLLSLCSFSPSLFAAAPGTLDTTFNSGGALPGTQRTTIDTATQAFGLGVAIQSDSKIVAVGIAVEGGVDRFAVARLNTNGLLDATFNPGGSLPGTVSTAIDNAANPSDGYSVAIQSDGKIVVAGTVTDSISGLTRIALARFNTNGTLDTATFNSGGTLPGTVSTAIDNPANNAFLFFVGGVAIQSDGKIVVTGAVTEGGIDKFAVARFNANGTLDTTFNAGGTLQGTVSTAIDNAANPSDGTSVAIQINGKIVVGGFVTEGGVNKFALAQFNTNGTLDTATFNSGGTLPGTVSTDIDSPTKPMDAFAQIALQQDGKIVIAGDVHNGASDFKFAAARFNLDGSIDMTFNSTGSLPGTASYFVDSIGQSSVGTSAALQINGQIVIAGYLLEGISIAEQFAVLRLNPNGLLDTTFNPSGTLPGTASTPFIPASTFVTASAVAIQSDNKIVLNGSIDEGGGVNKFALARFLGYPSIDNICA